MRTVRPLTQYVMEKFNAKNVRHALGIAASIRVNHMPYEEAIEKVDRIIDYMERTGESRERAATIVELDDD